MKRRIITDKITLGKSQEGKKMLRRLLSAWMPVFFRGAPGVVPELDESTVRSIERKMAQEIDRTCKAESCNGEIELAGLCFPMQVTCSRAVGSYPCNTCGLLHSVATGYPIICRSDNKGAFYCRRRARAYLQ